MTLAEKSLIKKIRDMAALGRHLPTRGQSRAKHEKRHTTARSNVPSSLARAGNIIAGIGDDCAVLRFAGQRGGEQDVLVTTDFSLEGMHFRREWHSPESAGHRCLARGLSDIAAMGGKPAAAFLSLALPAKLDESWADRFVRGLLELATEYGVTLAGGDTAESPNGILADIIVVGSVPKNKAVLRSGARPGDRIYVSGDLGGAAAAVAEMKRKPQEKLNPADYRRHFFPEPQVGLGRILREKGLASAMIDTSDGLSTDLAHICEESGVGAELQLESIPRARVGKPPREVDFEFALHGGEDYELLFTAPRTKRIPSRVAGVRITQIGHVTRGKKMYLTSLQGIAHELNPQGWEHFRK